MIKHGSVSKMNLLVKHSITLKLKLLSYLKVIQKIFQKLKVKSRLKAKIYVMKLFILQDASTEKT